MRHVSARVVRPPAQGTCTRWRVRWRVRWQLRWRHPRGVARRAMASWFGGQSLPLPLSLSLCGVGVGAVRASGQGLGSLVLGVAAVIGVAAVSVSAATETQTVSCCKRLRALLSPTLSPTDPVPCATSGPSPTPPAPIFLVPPPAYTRGAHACVRRRRHKEKRRMRRTPLASALWSRPLHYRRAPVPAFPPRLARILWEEL